MGTPAEPARAIRAAILVIGLLVPQGILYGPSLLGQKILLPLDLLALPATYLPQSPQYADVTPHNIAMFDLVTAINQRREFAVREVRAGRLPLWNPHTYCGAPFLAANNTAGTDRNTVMRFICRTNTKATKHRTANSTKASRGLTWPATMGR